VPIQLVASAATAARSSARRHRGGLRNRDVRESAEVGAVRELAEAGRGGLVAARDDRERVADAGEAGSGTMKKTVPPLFT
jgi:hypothetical protein